MSIVQARAAFTEAGKGLRLGRLELRNADDANNSQIMTVDGFRADGTAFSITSEPQDPRTPPVEIAQALARKVMATAPAAVLTAYLDRTIGELKSGAPLGDARPQEETVAGETDGVAPAAAPAAKPAAVDAAAMPRTPELNALIGNFGKLTESVEAMAARVNRRMESIAETAGANGEKFDRAIDPIETMVKVVGESADRLTNGGPP